MLANAKQNTGQPEDTHMLANAKQTTGQPVGTRMLANAKQNTGQPEDTHMMEWTEKFMLMNQRPVADRIVNACQQYLVGSTGQHARKNVGGTR